MCYNGSEETLYESTDYGYNAVYDLTSVSSTADGETQTNTMTYDKGTLHTVTDGAVKYQFDVSNDGEVSTFSVYEDESKITLQQQSFNNATLTATNKYYRENSGMPTDTFTTEYDEYGRALSESYNGSEKVEYTYTSTGESSAAQSVESVTDYYAETVTSYEYDENGSVKKAEKTNFGYGNLLTVEKVSSKQTKYTFGEDETYQTEVVYDEDVTISPRVKETKVLNSNSIAIPGMGKIYDYDEFGRVDEVLNITHEQGKNEENTSYTRDVENKASYKYNSGDGNAASQVTELNSLSETTYELLSNAASEPTVTRVGAKFVYTYDKKGNIETVATTQTRTIGLDDVSQDWNTVYGYDNFNRLTSEVNGELNFTRYFGYVDRKLRTVTTDGETKNYTYNNRGQLYQVINAQGNVEQSYTYDNYGNRLTNGSTTYTYTRGRMLASVGNATYTYDCNGMRSGKNVNGETTTYHYSGSTLLGEERGNNKLRYFYDATGICGFSYNGTVYSYIKDILGNVVMLLKNGTLCAKYSYDAWGNHKVFNPDGTENTASDFIGNVNPIRYRGYYYDVETGLYYLQFRYYDPTVGVFLSMDSAEYLAPEEINGVDLYAYCRYNPIRGYDPSGHFALTTFGIWAIVGIVSAAIIMGGGAQLISNALAGETGSDLWRGVVGAALGSGANALALCLVPFTGGASLAVSALIGAAVQTGVDTIETLIRGEDITLGQTVLDFGINFATTFIGNWLGSKIIPTNSGWFKPQRFMSVFTRPYGQKILLQTAIGAGLSGIINFARKFDWSSVDWKRFILGPIVPVYPIY